MASRISEPIISCHDVDQMVAFWSEMPDFVVLDTVETGPREGFGGLQPTLVVNPTSEPKAGMLRMHCDVNATGRDQDAELDRLLKLGAYPADVSETEEESRHVPADPEGNEFGLLRTRLS